MKTLIRTVSIVLLLIPVPSPSEPIGHKATQQKSVQVMGASGRPFTDIQCIINYHFGISGFKLVGSKTPRWKNASVQTNFEVNGLAETQLVIFKGKTQDLCQQLKEGWKKDCESKSKEFWKAQGKENKPECKRGLIPDANKGNSYLFNGFSEIEGSLYCTCIVFEKVKDANGCTKAQIIADRTEVIKER